MVNGIRRDDRSTATIMVTDSFAIPSPLPGSACDTAEDTSPNRHHQLGFGQRVDAVERLEEGPRCDVAETTGIGVDRTPVVRNRLRYVLGETPRARRNVRRIVSADPKPARRATA